MNEYLTQLVEITEPLVTVGRELADPYRWSEYDFEKPELDDDSFRRRQLMAAAERDVVEGVATRLRTLDEHLPASVAISGPDESSAADMILERLLHPTLIDSVYSLDVVLELRRRGDLLIRFARVVSFLTSAGTQGWLDRENHGMGYHFRYLTLRDLVRTNVLLTFDRRELSPPDTLYWEHHGQGMRVAEPSKWGRARTRAVYDAAKPSLSKPGKTSFKLPDRSALVLSQQ